MARHGALVAFFIGCGLAVTRAQQYGSNMVSSYAAPAGSSVASPSSSYGSPVSSSSYGSSPSSSSYGSSPSSSSYGSLPSSYSSSSGSSPTSSVNYGPVNLPLLSIPVTVGNATLGGTGTSSTGTSSSSSSTNFLASLPSSPTANLSPPRYMNGVYVNDYDASRDFYYNHSLDNDIYVQNIYTNPINGLGGALNLSNPVAVSVAQWWAPYPYRLAAWNDGYTTTVSSASSTVAGSGTATVAGGASVVNASLYYAAYGGNIQGLGQPGLGMQVPGPAPTNILTPSLNLGYSATNTASNSATSAPISSSYGGSSSSYGSSPSSYGSSPSSSSSSYGSAPSMSSGYGSPSPSPSPSPSSYGRRRR